MLKIFVSYNTNDTDKARRLCEVLSTDGRIYVYAFEFVSPSLGESIHKRVENEIKNSHYVAVLWSKFSAKSEWVNNEISLAKVYNKKIVPILLENNIELSFEIADYQGIRAFKRKDWDVYFRNLIIQTATFQKYTENKTLKESEKNSIFEKITNRMGGIITRDFLKFFLTK